ncbi:amidohydrolase family protein [Nonomuraea roseoviolacea]|uniref:Cytosine/adenosine deaminase-related metal-dependent hydrolase n=1 Tax=Nonomuraea roseoviolacea subsp. carminata TaxID=160689 RepID=A0ABT1KET1_9ACTN|nr:amidohydrolase family protein [Nonomuraea roseoviolacea]MCP2352528.1 cytosine/adenosine deaminase-related metal-dependent hydrolase [Nonomuraea roseoviolacea subsp. carminata]
MLPKRTDLLISGTYLISMDPDVGDLPCADVLIGDGRIVDVRPHDPVAHPDAHQPAAPGRRPADHGGVTVIDGTGTVTLPGFVDTHWHLWNSLLRGTVGDRPGTDYFTVKRALAPHFELDDFYWAARLGLAEAVSGGITTVHNFDHNVRGPEDADANIRAHLDSGLRGRFSYGPPDSAAPDSPNDLDDLAALRARWPAARLDGRLDFGIAVRGPYRTPPEVYEREWATARSLGLPITMHCDRCLREEGCRSCGLTRLEELGLLGEDVQVIHAVHAGEQDIRALARTRTRVSLSPMTEMRTMGFPLLTELLDAGVRVSLSLDTLAMPTSADILGHLRAIVSVEAARTGSATVTPRRLLRLATLDGAHDLGLQDVTGSVTPGKRADLVILRSTDINLTPSGDPAEALVYTGQIDNIDTVIADGRVLKRHGRRVLADGEPDPVAMAAAHRDALLRRAAAAGDWRPPAAGDTTAARETGPDR